MFKHTTIFETSDGLVGLGWSGAGLTRVRPFATHAQQVAVRGAVFVPEAEVPASVAAIIAGLRTFLAGQPFDFGAAALDTSGLSAFDAALYGALRDVPWGETVTYGELAGRIGAEAGAARAVGAAMGRNPWPLVVPCHRVLAAGGKPGGFSAPGGAGTKARLLAREGVYLDGGQLTLFE